MGANGSDDMKPSDLAILVMGITGSGKSTFISSLADQDVGIGHGLSSYTTPANIFSCESGSRRVYLIDTPGFDDTYRADIDILKEISFILCRLYQSDIRVAGVMYLHPIIQNRFAGSSKKNMNVIKALCGKDAWPRITLITTMWDNLMPDTNAINIAENREIELRTQDRFWGDMCKAGSPVTRWYGTKKSAEAIIADHILSINSLDESLGLQMQRELVDEQRTLANTEAGRIINADISAIMMKHEKDLRALREDFAAKMARGDQAQVQEQDFEIDIEEARASKKRLDIGYAELKDERQFIWKTVMESVDKERVAILEALTKYERDLRLLQQERLRDVKDYEAAQKEYEKELVKVEEQILAARRSDQAHRVSILQAKRDQLVEDFSDYKSQFEEERQRVSDRTATTKAKIKKKKKERLQDNIFPLLGVLAGIGVIAAGGTTGIVSLIGGGVSMITTSIGKMSFKSE